jgi:hypothetical protein
MSQVRSPPSDLNQLNGVILLTSVALIGSSAESPSLPPSLPIGDYGTSLVGDGSQVAHSQSQFALADFVSVAAISTVRLRGCPLRNRLYL